MRKLVFVIFAIVAGFSGAAVAQSTQGRWECHGAAPTDPTVVAPHGLLAIFGQSYTYVSSAFHDPVSGDGGVEQQEAGIAFTDGSLASNAGIEIGQINQGSGAVSMDLTGAKGVVLSCLAM